MQEGRPVLTFNLLSDQWDMPVVLDNKGDVYAEGSYGGPVRVIGTAPLTTGVVKGQATIAFSKGTSQGGCSESPILVGFTAERIPAAAHPPDPDKSPK